MRLILETGWAVKMVPAGPWKAYWITTASSTTNKKQIKVYFKKQLVGEYYSDLLVEDKVIVELKATELIMNVHVAQIMNYLKATKLKLECY